MAAGAVVVVMAKHPTPGAVKTRLAATLGAEPACNLYCAFLADLAAALAGGPWRVVWAVDPPAADLSAVVGADCAQIGQRGADLAARMAHCFTALFAAGAERVVMIGADAPHLDGACLQQAFAALDRCDVVLRPTHDGGYCLIGMRAAHDLFTGIAMSTPTVCEQTQARSAALGLRLALLDVTFDVDEVADLDALAELIAGGTVRLPHTAAALAVLANR